MSDSTSRYRTYFFVLLNYLFTIYAFYILLIPWRGHWVLTAAPLIRSSYLRNQVRNTFFHHSSPISTTCQTQSKSTQETKKEAEDVRRVHPYRSGIRKQEHASTARLTRKSYQVSRGEICPKMHKNGFNLKTTCSN